MSKFNKGLWRHSNKHGSLDMKVLSTLHVNSERTKLKVMYVSISSGSIQYTGRGTNYITDIVRVLKQDYDSWSRINERA